MNRLTVRLCSNSLVVAHWRAVLRSGIVKSSAYLSHGNLNGCTLVGVIGFFATGVVLGLDSSAKYMAGSALGAGTEAFTSNCCLPLYFSFKFSFTCPSPRLARKMACWASHCSSKKSSLPPDPPPWIGLKSNQPLRVVNVF